MRDSDLQNAGGTRTSNTGLKHRDTGTEEKPKNYCSGGRKNNVLLAAEGKKMFWRKEKVVVVVVVGCCLSVARFFLLPTNAGVRKMVNGGREKWRK